MKKRILSLFLALTLCLTLLPTAAFAEGGVYVPPGSPTEGGGGTYIPGEDTRTEIWCVSKPDSIGRSYDGTTDGGRVTITLTFTDGTNEIAFKEGTDFTAVKTFDSADAGWHTVTVEITLIGDAATKYKLKEGEGTFTIDGHINRAYPELTVSLSKTTCAVGEKLLPLLSVSGVEEDAAVTYYYTPIKSGYLEFEDSEAVPKIDENTAISEPGTYYVYAKTAETKNYEEQRSTTVELTVAEKVNPVVSVLASDGTQTDYASLPEAMKAAPDSGTVRLNEDVWLIARYLDDGFTAETALAVSGKSITLDLNGYVLGSDDVPLTVKSGAALTLKNADGENSPRYTSASTALKVGLRLDLFVEKGSSFTCTDGVFQSLKLLNTGEGGYDLKLAEGENYCTFGFFLSDDTAVTVDDVLKANHAGMALHATNTGFKVQIERSTCISQIDSIINAFYVGPCSGHEFSNGACIACGALTCNEKNPGDDEGGCIAHVTIEHYTWHIKTLDQIVYHLSNVGDWSSNYKTVTVEFLSDVTTDTTFLIGRCYTYVTLDLNGHTISGELSGSPVAEVNYDYGVQRVIIQNGTIENTAENGTALQLSSGATTLENVDVKGNLALTYRFASGANYTPTFLGGGSFTRICPVANDANGKWSKKLSEMLGEGCCFLDSEGKRINADQLFGSNNNTAIKELVNVQVKACDHKDDNGEYTLFDNATMSYGSPAKRCKVCSNLCPHDEITGGSTPQCTVCGLPIVIKTTNLLSGKDIGPWYYTGLNDAMYEILHVHKGRRPTLELLADTASDSSYEWMTNDYDGIFIDLAGHTLTLTGDQNKTSYWVTFQNTSDTHAEVRGTVNVYYEVDKSKLVILDTDNDLTIENVKFWDGGKAELAGGSFGKITVPEGKPLASLLVSGYYFADSNSTTDEPAALYGADGTALTELTNVTVKLCSHDEAIYVPADGGAWKCFCGQKTFVASITKGEATTYYTDLQEAFSAADGGTVKLMANVGDVAVNTEKPFIFDLNGYNIYKLTVNSKITLKDSAETKGKITEWLIVPSGMTIGELLEDGYAFKKADGTWPAETEQAVGNVSILPVPILSVTLEALNVKDNTEALTTMPYGTTGGVKLSASCNISNLIIPDCKWYKIGGTASLINDATGMNYFLPDDLIAGTHTYRVTFISDGYEKSADITITVTPVSLEGATVAVGDLTYNGDAQTPEVTVTLDKKVLTKDKDYTLTGAEQTNAGSYHLTVTGKGGYEGEIGNVDWKIEPKTVTNPTINVAPCVYNGFEQTPRVELKDGERGIPEGEYTVAYSNNINAGDGSLTIQDAAGGNYVVSGSTTFPIEQASINTSNRWIEVRVFNELAKTYEVELQPNLDNILYEQRIDGTFGTVTYSLDEDGASTYADYYELGTAKIENGKLILPIKNGSGVPSGNYIVTLMLRVESTNFKSFDLPVHIIARDKIVPMLAEGSTVSATDITYGQTLADSTLTVDGSMEAPSFDAPGTIQEIKGTFAWTDGTARPEAGDYEAEWTFTPDASYGGVYANATGKVTVTVSPAQLQNVSVIQGLPMPLYYTGEPQRAGVSAAGLGVRGERPTFTYSKTENGEYTSEVPEFTEAGTYTVYYKAEAANHVTATGSFSVQIKPLPISLLSIEKISKTYDGTASVMLSTNMLTFFSKAAKRSDIKLPDLALSFSDARFTKLQDGEYVDSPEVGGGKALSFTMTLESGNYVFESKKEDPKTIDVDYATGDATKFTITKADAPTATAGTLNVVNGTILKYTYELKDLLPAAPRGEYGEVTYDSTLLQISLSRGYTIYDESAVKIENGVLTLPLDTAADKSLQKTGTVGTITIPVSTENYEDFTLTLNLNAVNKIKLTPGTIRCSAITYGEKLSASTISGKMYAQDETGTEVPGKFYWELPDTVPTDGTTVVYVFIPTEATKYDSYTGELSIPVNPKSIEGAAVTVTNPTYDGYAWPYPAGVEVKLDGKTLGYQVDYTYATLNPPAFNAGDSHTLTIQGIGCYTGEITRTWTIEPRDVPNPGLTVADGVYNGGNPVEPTVTLTDDRGKTIDAKEYTATFENNINAGIGTVTIKDVDGGNYVLGTASTTFKINKAESTATAPTANDLTYNGKNQVLVTAGTANGGTIVYSLSETGGYSNQIPTGKDAGSYTVYYKVVGDDNHNDTTVDSVSVTIQKAKVTVTAENKSSRVGQSLKELSFTCQPALFGEDVFTGALACEADKDKTGSYEITQGSLALNGNYAVTFVKGTYTVEAKLQQSGFKFGANTKTVTYGDVDFPFAATGAAEGSTVTYSSQNENVAVVDDDGTVHILMAGETTITAMASETMDYVKGMAEYTLKVDPKTLHSTDLEQTGGAITKVYDGTTKAEGITVGVKEASLVGTDTLSITGSAVYNSANVDKATEIIFTPDAITEGNYRLAAAETLTISGASITQATPVYTAPTGLTAKYGQTLADVALPSGWSWEDGSTSVGDASATAKTFKATFTPDDPVNYQTVSGIDVELLVNKAEGRNLYSTEQSQKYTDNQEHLFEPDWSDLPEGQNWIFGSTYRRGEGSKVHISRLENNLSGSKLIYALDSGKAGETVDLILTANCGNYEAFTITLRVTLTDRDEQTALRITGADTVVYGQTLALGVTGGSGTGAVTYAATNGTGEASIEADTGVLTPVKVGTVTVTATKAGDSEYSNVVSAPFTVTITKAASTGEPGYTRITTSGKTLADAELTLTGSTLMPNAGTLEWVDDKGNVLPDDTKIAANKRYTWRFTPADDNYAVLTGEVELYHVSSGGSSGSTTTPVITVPVSSDKETVKVDASVSNGVATVKVTDRQLEQVATNTDTVTVDVSGLKNVDSAKLPASIVEKSEQSGAELTVALSTGSVTLDAAALAAVGNGKDVTVSVQKVALTDAQRDAVGSLAQVAIVVDVNVLTGTAKRSNFNGGKLTVSIPYTLKSGEDPTKLQVWFIRDDGSIENMSGSYDRKTGCFVFSTEHLSCYLLVSTAGTQRFADVPASAYYAEAVAWAVKNGITGGTSATTFDPNGFCTRAQAVTFLWRAAGSPAPKSTAMPFTDVPAGSYYYDAVLWAIENGVTKGTSDTTFSPNANCSRGQIVTFLWRSQKSPDAAAANPFTDVAADAYYTSAVLWAVEKSITGGTSATTFSPSANCTRAQIVTFIYRCMK